MIWLSSKPPHSRGIRSFAVGSTLEYAILRRYSLQVFCKLEGNARVGEPRRSVHLLPSISDLTV
jgi:hypothetical protein